MECSKKMFVFGERSLASGFTVCVILASLLLICLLVSVDNQPIITPKLTNTLSANSNTSNNTFLERIDGRNETDSLPISSNYSVIEPKFGNNRTKNFNFNNSINAVSITTLTREKPALDKTIGGNSSGNANVIGTDSLENVTDKAAISTIENVPDTESETSFKNETNVDKGKNYSNVYDDRNSSRLKDKNKNFSHSFTDTNQAGLSQEKYDIFDGKWVRDESYPLYPPGSCPYIDDGFDCYKNGRHDLDFLNWRWQPNQRNIPRLNAMGFLERLRGKRLLFVGDSLNRNMWESLVCALRHSISDKSKVFEISGKTRFKTNSYCSFRFEDYECHVDYARSPFLVKESYQNSSNMEDRKLNRKLRLDMLDENTKAYHKADIIIFNTGHWWNHKKTSRGINYFQEGNYMYPSLNVLKAYRKALTTWAKWVDNNINPSKTQVVFRGYSLGHFNGGQWNSGGQCHKETEPIFNETYQSHYPSKMRALEQVLKEMKTPVIYLNISRLTGYRKDAHPSIYGKKYNSIEEQIAAEKSQDCSHWCLPGVPDSWNELLYASLLKAGKGSWRN